MQVDPAYTLQTCAVCQHVDKENRKTQAVFKYTACRHTANADRNAAVNILVREAVPETGPRSRGLCTARGVPVRDSDAPCTKQAGPSGPAPYRVSNPRN